MKRKIYYKIYIQPNTSIRSEIGKIYNPTKEVVEVLMRKVMIKKWWEFWK